jgi:rRNA maturation endonuclease Nob1
MALKSKLSQADYDALPDHFKPEYEQSGTDWLLQTDELTELRGAKKREKDRADALQAQVDAANAKVAEADRLAAEAAAEAARKANDIPTLEKSWDEKVKATKAEGDARVAATNKKLEQLLVDNKALEIASAIATDAGAAKLLLPHVKARLKAETEGDIAITRVLDVDGKPSAMSIDDLQKEFVANKDFGAIIKASNATGGGAASNPGGGNGGGASGKKLSEMSEKERVDLSRTNPAEWARVKQAGG